MKQFSGGALAQQELPVLFFTLPKHDIFDVSLHITCSEV